MNTPKTTEAAIPKAQVLLVDDHAVVRSGLERQINSEPDMTVCAEAENAPEALAAIEKHRPDVAVVDLTLRESHGLELVKSIYDRHPGLPVVVFSMHDEALYAQRTLKAGARGYVMKHEKPQKLIKAIRDVLAGDFHLSARITRQVLSSVTGDPTRRGVIGEQTLTDRELEIFELIGGGLSAKEIAGVLNLATKTVLSHRENIRRKLGVATSADLLRRAIHWVRARHGD